MPQRNPDRSGAIEAAGERIVAFARSGKPPAKGFLRQAERGPASAKPMAFSLARNGF